MPPTRPRHLRAGAPSPLAARPSPLAPCARAHSHARAGAPTTRGGNGRPRSRWPPTNLGERVPQPVRLEAAAVVLVHQPGLGHGEEKGGRDAAQNAARQQRAVVVVVLGERRWGEGGAAQAVVTQLHHDRTKL
jgi:hypothetical protein